MVLGFKARHIECEELPYRLRKQIPFAQELEFVPVSGQYYGKLDELELLFFSITYNSLEVIMEVDRKSRGLAGLFAEALDLDEKVIRFTVTNEDIPMIKEKINNHIF